MLPFVQQSSFEALRRILPFNQSCCTDFTSFGKQPLTSQRWVSVREANIRENRQRMNND